MPTPAPVLTPLYPPFGKLQLPVFGWKIWRNATQFWTSDVEPHFGNVDNRVQAIAWFHQWPYVTRDYGNSTYTLADGTTRTSGTAMSETAWQQLESKMNNMTKADWPLLGVEKVQA